MDLMIDLETLGVNPGCSILSIGAVLFDPHSLEPPQRSFYIEICRQSCLDAGLTEEPNTLEWWATQGNMPVGTTPLKTALDSFFLWISNHQPITGLWANSPSFDFTILKAACLHRHYPLYYGLERDVRTVKALFFPKLKLANDHNALSDATNQAKLIQLAYWRIKNEDRLQQPSN